MLNSIRFFGKDISIRNVRLWKHIFLICETKKVIRKKAVKTYRSYLLNQRRNLKKAVFLSRLSCDRMKIFIE
jgi:hypothetical protein